jgi:ADP-ribose pyrophosphatase
MERGKTKTPDGAYPDRPRVAVGAIVFNRNSVLLVLRGKPPAQHLWSIPGGSVKLGETLQQAAEREIHEETGLHIHAREPIYTFDVVDRDDNGNVRFHYVIVDLLADCVGGTLRPGDDALDVRWVSAEEIKNLALSEATRKLLDRCFKFASPAPPKPDSG